MRAPPDIKADVAPKRKRNAAFRVLPVSVEQSPQHLKLSVIEERLIADFRRVSGERQQIISKFTHGCMLRDVERVNNVAPRFVLIQGGVR